MKILLVDDDPFVLKLLSVQLRKFGPADMDLVCHTSGQAAVSLLEQGQHIDIIFCDLQMPEMDGVEFVRHLVRLCYSGNLVLFSGENHRTRQAVEQLARAHGLHVLGALSKPMTTESLLDLLNRAAPALPHQAPWRRDPCIRQPIYSSPSTRANY